jgi:hypothetical protein
MDSAKAEHDTDSESYSASSQNEENIGSRRSNDVPVLLVADVRHAFIFNLVISYCY